MRSPVLVIAIEPAKNFYPAVTLLSRYASVYLLTTPHSEFCEPAHRRRLEKLHCALVIHESPHRALIRLLTRRQFVSIMLFMRESALIRGFIKDIRLHAPRTAIAIYADDMSFFDPAPAADQARNRWMYEHIEEFKINRLMAYAQTDLIIAESQQDGHFLHAELPGHPIDVADWNTVNGRKKTAECFARLVTVNTAVRPAAARPLTSIVLLSCNRLEFTRRCIRSLRRYTAAPYELIIIDNGSDGETVDYLKSLSRVRTIFNPSNYGFAHACNQGMRAASGGYVVLLNNDTVLTPGWLDGMIECAQSSRAIGMVGPRTNNIYGVQQLHHVEYRTMEDMASWSRIYRMANRGEWFEVFWLTGFCLLIKREVIARIGMLDEQFRMGTFEDHDYCARARKAGFRLFCAGDVFIHHYGTRSYTTEKIMKLSRRNRGLFIRKWGPTAYDFLLESTFYGVIGITGNQ